MAQGSETRTVDQLWREMERYLDIAMGESEAIATEAGEARIINHNERLYSALATVKQSVETLKQLHSPAA